MVLERLLAIEIEVGSFQAGVRRGQLRLGLFDRAFQRGDLPADAIDGGLLGRDPGARGVNRDAIIAVVDPEDHLAGPDHRIVAGQDGSNMARHPGAERGVVGAHIGVVGADEEPPDQKIMHAIGCGGEREQRHDADQHRSAPAGFRRRRLAHGDGRRIGRGPRRRLGGVTRDRVFRKMGAKRFGERRGSLPRRLVFRRIRPRTTDAGGLISRCGHRGLP